MEDKYVMREIQDCIDEIGKERSNIFSTIDLTSGFWQQVLHTSCREYTAFMVPGRGQFKWVTMPMGLHEAPSSFARLMDHIMAGITGIITYLDDILIHPSSYKQHLKTLRKALEQLRKFGLKLNLKKCAFAAPSIPYLGFTLTPEGVKPGEEKTKAVQEFLPPKNVKQIREFTGLTNYFRHMIPGYALAAGHLTALMKKDSGWEGGNLSSNAKKAFEHLKQALCSAPVLAFPRQDIFMDMFSV